MAQDGDKKKNYSIPIGLKELLEDMSCYALRLQPKNENLHPFFADYLEMRLGLRERGEFYVRDFDAAKQGSPTGDSNKKAGGNNGGNKGKESVSSNSSSKGRLEKSGSGSQQSGGSGPQRSSSEPKNNVNEPQGQKDGTNTRQRLSLDTTIRKPSHTTARAHVDHVLDEALELLNTLDELDEDPMLSQLQGEIPDQTGAAAGQGRGIRARGRDPSISDLASEDRIIVREIQELKGQVNNLKNHLDDLMGRPHTALGQEPGHKGQAGTRSSISYTDPVTGKRLRKSVSNPEGPVQAANGSYARQTQSLPQAGTSGQGIDPATGKPYGYINELAINPATGKPFQYFDGKAINPATGEPFEYINGQAINPATGKPFETISINGQAINPATGKPFDYVNGKAINPATGEPFEYINGQAINPATGKPFETININRQAINPATGKPFDYINGKAINPATGEPFEYINGQAINPATGKPFETININGQAINPATGKPFDYINGKAINPATGEPFQYVNGQALNPATGRPFQVSNGQAIDPANGKPIGDVKGRGILPIINITPEQVESVYGFPSMPTVAGFGEAVAEMNNRIAEFWRDSIMAGDASKWADAVKEFGTEQIQIIRKLLTGETPLSQAPAQASFLAISLIIGLVLSYKILRSVTRSETKPKPMGFLSPSARKCPM